MRKKNRWFLALACVITAAAAALAFSGAFARYLEMLTGDQAFQVKPMDALEISQQWVQAEDAYVLNVTAGEQAKNCRIYLAVSEGVTDAESLQVELAVPSKESAGQTSSETVTLLASCEPITKGSAVYNLFGSGTVFQFVDAGTGQEMAFDLSQETYTLTVRGLDSAAELTSLLRLFVEYVQE